MHGTLSALFALFLPHLMHHPFALEQQVTRAALDAAAAVGTLGIILRV